MKKKPNSTRNDKSNKDQESQKKKEFQKWYAALEEEFPLAAAHFLKLVKKEKFKNVNRAMADLKASMPAIKLFLTEGLAEMSEEEILSADLQKLQTNLMFAFQFIEADLPIRLRRESKIQGAIDQAISDLKQRKLEEVLRKEAEDARKKELEKAVEKISLKNPYWKPASHHSSDFYYLNEELRPGFVREIAA